MNMERIRKNIGSLTSWIEKWNLTDRVTRAAYVYMTGGRYVGFWSYLEKFSLIENGRPAARAGQFRPSTKEIELHSIILVAGKEADCNETLLHEIAHAMVSFMQFPHGHGEDWRRAMRSLACSPDRLHNIPELLENRAEGRDVRYDCVKCGCIFKRSRKLPNKVYTHTKCGGTLKWVS